MKKQILILLFVSFATQLMGQKRVESFKKIKELGGIEEYIYLPNQLQILLLKDNSSPVVTVQMVYRVGSKHEVLGNTGSTHLLEHLLFKGTPTFNKEKGLTITDAIQNVGGSLNATTWNDRTNYFETIPSDHINLALKIEADRMRNSFLLAEDKEAEMTVVRNEFEQGENNPAELLSKEIWAAAYIAHPYHHSTIGWRSDIEKAPIETLRNFYNTYYWPNNATLTIIGDFNKSQVFDLVDKYFRKIPKAPHEIPQPITEEPVQYGPRKITIRKPGEIGLVSKAYKIPGRMHEDLPALNILADIISTGPSSLLNKTFVENDLGIYAGASASNFQDLGLFNIIIASPSTEPNVIEDKIDSVVNFIRNNGVTQEQIDKAANKTRVETILYRDGSSIVSSELAEAIAGGDWTDYILGVERLGKVTVEDVKRVAEKYLQNDQSTTGYFIPKKTGSIDLNTIGQANYFKPNHYFYRNPKLVNYINLSENFDKKPTTSANLDRPDHSSNFILPNVKRKYLRKKIAGIDVVTVNTESKGFVTVSGSFTGGDYYSGQNTMIASLVTQMLSRGTLKKDKFKFSEVLEELGVQIRIWNDNFKTSFNFRCLKEDVEKVVSLLAEELRQPLFDEEEFVKLKQIVKGNLQQQLDDTEIRADITFAQAIYPLGHPNYRYDISRLIEDTESATLDDLKKYYSKYYGPKSMRFVVVGDVDTKTVYKALSNSFSSWKGGVDDPNLAVELAKIDPNPLSNVVSIEEKPSANLVIGQYIGLKPGDNDFLPLQVASYALGGGFAGRLMQTVRDEEGLTYTIGANIQADPFSRGHWQVYATFNPDLFQKGLASTIKQVESWISKGLSQRELDNKKSNLIGAFKVRLSTTGALAGTILDFLERGLTPDYIDEYPKEIEYLTLSQVNETIKKYIQLENFTIIKSGSFDQNGTPLKQ